ncbi:general amino acid permease agp2 [Elasticomyces elasticus]|nr:general amino acid permease agp2 [Elasticomyces elasticus]
MRGGKWTLWTGLRAFAILFVFWKLAKRTKFRPISDIDLISGKREIDAMEGQWPEVVPKIFLQKVSVFDVLLEYTPC